VLSVAANYVGHASRPYQRRRAPFPILNSWLSKPTVCDSYIWLVTMNKPNADSQRSKDSKDRLRFEAFSFGSICIDGTTYEHDVVIDRGEIRKRKKKPSKKYREKFGHTPLSIEEDIPWKCRRLVIGTGAGALPVMEEVKQEAHRREVELTIVPTVEAIKALQENPAHTNAILHVTC
jgi:hypothetical protein